MNYRVVSYVLGKIALVLGGLLILPLIVAFYYNMNGFKEVTYQSYVIPIILLIGIGILLTFKKPKKTNVYAKEGLVICGLAWIFMSAFGALPFMISGAIPNFIDAFFETASGFTTTGSTVLSEIESLPKSILFWRSFTHWIGGMGILSFVIAVIPKSESHSMFIMRAEVPGPKAGKVVSKIQKSARILYVIYGVITVIEMIFLSAGGMRLYDSVVTAFATAGTGGFAVKNASIAGYGSSYVEWVVIVFMFLFGVNFNLYYFLLIGRFSSVFKDEELRAYIGINLVGSILIAINIANSYDNISTAIRDAFFSVNTVMSTTGFCTADFDTWPVFSKILLVVLMFFGCSAGSTGGGIKISRIVIYFKEVSADFKRMLKPHSVLKVRMNGQAVDKEMLKGVNSYLVAYVITLVISVVLVSLEPLQGFDTTTAFTSVVACFNNIGPGLSIVGPTGNYGALSSFTKIILTFDMLAGRLELFPILLLFAPSTWRKVK